MIVQHSGGRLVVDQLEAEGIRTAFCVPGESYLDVLDALHDSAIRLVVCRHEGGAGYMADAYARLTGTVGVCMVTRGPGAANAMVALHTAWQDSTPLVLFVGLVPRGDTEREAFQEFDLKGWFGTTAKWVVTLDRAERVPEVLARAFATARSGRPGPVVVGLPEDMLRDVVAAQAAPPIKVTGPAPSRAALDEVGRLLSEARRPLVVVGGGGWTAEAGRQVQRWAEANSVPVGSEFNALDLVDNDSSSYIGSLGFGRSAEQAQAMREADLVIGIGSPLGDAVTDSWDLLPVHSPGTRVVMVVPDDRAAGSAHPDSLRVLSTVPEFAAALNDLPTTLDPVWAGSTVSLRRAFEHRRVPEPTGGELDLNIVFDVLARALPADAIVTWGAGNHALWAGRFLRWRSCPSLLAPRNGSMGYGVPAAVAAGVAYPERRVISVSGDGCFLMNGQEIATAAAQNVAPVFVVVNNSMYGTIRTHQELEHPSRVSGTSLVNPDFASYARAFGGHGEVVETTEQFPRALERALDAGVPAVVELRVRDGRLTPDETVESLRRLGMQSG